MCKGRELWGRIKWPHRQMEKDQYPHHSPTQAPRLGTVSGGKEHPLLPPSGPHEGGRTVTVQRRVQLEVPGQPWRGDVSSRGFLNQPTPPP